MAQIKRYLEILKNQRAYFIVLLCFYALGVLLGLFLPIKSERVFVSGNAVNFVIKALSPCSSPLKLFLSEMLSDVGCFAVFFITSLTVFTLPFHFAVVTCRGYVVGAAVIGFTGSFGFTGLVVFVFIVLVKNLLTTLGLATFSTFSYDLLKAVDKCKPLDYGKLFEAWLFGLAISFVGLILQIILLVFVFRPLNFNF